MARGKGPRFYRTTKPASHHINQAVALLQEYPEIVASYHVGQEQDGMKVLAFGLRMPDGTVAPVQLSPDIGGLEERLEEVDRSDTADPPAVAWAQVATLLEMQLEAVASGAARGSEVFGGAVLTSGSRTVGQAMEEGAADILPGETPLLGSG